MFSRSQLNQRCGIVEERKRPDRGVRQVSGHKKTSAISELRDPTTAPHVNQFNHHMAISTVHKRTGTVAQNSRRNPTGEVAKRCCSTGLCQTCHVTNHPTSRRCIDRGLSRERHTAPPNAGSDRVQKAGLLRCYTPNTFATAPTQFENKTRIRPGGTLPASQVKQVLQSTERRQRRRNRVVFEMPAKHVRNQYHGQCKRRLSKLPTNTAG